ncbi:MAG: class I SAM-dependent methyltransferase [Clostridia bacterium]|nr:class I SAM-dependent methyltransferase [Clostridia bacterium]
MLLKGHSSVSGDQLSDINKTMYIPLYGKSFVSKKGVILKDEKAEAIWENEGFELNGRASSRWLAYYMGMRAAVFDKWLTQNLTLNPNATVIHIGCGLDSRALRVKAPRAMWFDIDLPQVIKQRRIYYNDDDSYKMLPIDVTSSDWISSIPKGEQAYVVMEGVSMYLTQAQFKDLMLAMEAHFDKVSVLADFYTVLGAKMSKLRNPVKNVGVSTVFGIEDPADLQGEALALEKEYNMTPDELVAELNGAEKSVFKMLYAGNISKKLYKMYEYVKKTP